MLRPCRRSNLLMLAALLLALTAAAPARAATVIAYSAPDNAYGWCAGYGLSYGRSCAKQYCQQSGGSQCQPVAECDGGWGAVALADAPYRGFAAACGGSEFAARAWALSHCMATTNALCSIDSTFDAHANTAGAGSDRDFTTIWFIQVMLQVRRYELGDADGEVGPLTSAAIAKFQSDVGIPQTGQPDGELLDRLLDALGGAGRLVAVLDRDLVKAGKFAQETGYADAPSPAPPRTMGADLMALSPERRLIALATMLKTSGSDCAIPAKNAALMSDDKDSAIWSIECDEDTYTMIVSADGSRMTMRGKATVETDDGSSAPSGGSSTTPSGGDSGTGGTNRNAGENHRPGG
jgi:peptidoglycan hydrolase-like protein with peptidoglycan-binding domain